MKLYNKVSLRIDDKDGKGYGRGAGDHILMKRGNNRSCREKCSFFSSFQSQNGREKN